MKLPPLKLDFISSITDNTGLLQHTKFGIPWREKGYTTDDNARAIIALTKYFKVNGSSETIDRLIDTYLSFIFLCKEKMEKCITYSAMIDSSWITKVQKTAWVAHSGLAVTS